MLTNLHVKNIALIDEIDIDFENGLTILSGRQVRVSRLFSGL